MENKRALARVKYEPPAELLHKGKFMSKEEIMEKFRSAER